MVGTGENGKQGHFPVKAGKGLFSACVKLLAIIAAMVVAVVVAAGCASVPSSGTGADTASGDSGVSVSAAQSSVPSYTFRSKSQLKDHFKKHGVEMGFESMQDYLAAANAVISNPEALHKTQREDGDDVYYLQSTDELVIVSTDGFIRTYFKPGGISYYSKQ